MRETAEFSEDKANKELTLIKALFNHGIEKQWFDFNPTKGIKPIGLDKKPKYIPTTGDIEKILSAANEEQRCYLLTIILTMARVREINRLRWADVHENYLVLKTRKAKNSQVSLRQIPITPSIERSVGVPTEKGRVCFSQSADGKKL